MLISLLLRRVVIPEDIGYTSRASRILDFEAGGSEAVGVLSPVLSPVSSQISCSSKLGLVVSSQKLISCGSGTLAKAHSFKMSSLSAPTQVLRQKSSLKSVIIEDRQCRFVKRVVGS